MERRGNRKFISLIMLKFDSVSAFARHLGWTRQKLDRIVCGGRLPDIDEAVVMAKALEVDLNTMADIFLP